MREEDEECGRGGRSGFTTSSTPSVTRHSSSKTCGSFSVLSCEIEARERDTGHCCRTSQITNQSQSMNCPFFYQETPSESDVPGGTAPKLSEPSLLNRRARQSESSSLSSSSFAAPSGSDLEVLEEILLNKDGDRTYRQNSCASKCITVCNRRSAALLWRFIERKIWVLPLREDSALRVKATAQRAFDRVAEGENRRGWRRQRVQAGKEAKGKTSAVCLSAPVARFFFSRSPCVNLALGYHCARGAATRRRAETGESPVASSQKPSLQSSVLLNGMFLC